MRSSRLAASLQGISKRIEGEEATAQRHSSVPQRPRRSGRVFEMKKIKLKKSDRPIYILLVLMIFLSTAPLTSGDSTLGSEQLRSVISAISALLILCGYVLVFLQIKRIRTKHILLALIPILFLIIDRANIYTSYEIGILGTLITVLFMLQSDRDKLRLFIAYKKYIVFIASFGVMAMILYYLSIPPIRTVQFYSKVMDYQYIDYGLSYFVQEGNRVRLAGMFNEAGYFGTVIGFILCCDKIDLSKKENVILFLAGILTWSLAFIVIVSAFYVMQAFKKSKKMMIVLLGVFVYIFIVPNIHTGIEAIDTILLRVSIGLDGKFVGDNRVTDKVMLTLANMFSSTKWIWGYGTGYVRTFSSAAAGIKVDLIIHGVMGCVIEFGYMLMMALDQYRRRRSFEVLAFIFVFFLSLYQRSNVYTLVYMVILFGGIEYMQQNSERV